MRYKTVHRALVIVIPLAVIAFGVCAAWLVIRHVTLPPCPSMYLFHIYCPGCGSTRAVEAMLRGDFLLMIRQNAAVPAMILLTFLYYLEFALEVWGIRLRIPPLHSRLFIGALIFFWVVYAVIRNFVPALAPVDIH